MNLIPFIQMSYLSSRIVGLVFYLVNAYAIFKLALVRNFVYPWMAFIPFLNLYMFGMIGDSLKYMNRKIDDAIGNIPLAYALPIASMVVSMIGGSLGGIARILIQLACIVVYYLVFSFYAYKNRILFTVLSIIPVVGPALIIYSLRNQRI